LSSLETRQAELQNRISQIDSEIAKLDADFTALAASFNGTDGASSLRQAEQIEQRLSALRREKAMSIAAQSHVTKLQLDEKAAQAEADRRARIAEAKQHATAIVTLNNEIDQQLSKLREMFERRFACLSQLAATGVVDSGFVTKLQGKSGPTRAFCASGLHRFVAVEKVGQTSFVPLASVNSILLTIGKDKANGGAANAENARQQGTSELAGANGGNGSIPRHRRNGGDA
jgi:hypothetical protein